MNLCEKKSIHGAGFMALLLFFLASALAAQTADDSALFQTLMDRLRERNMTQERLREFEQEAARFGWGEMRELDPKRLAYALEYCLNGTDRLGSQVRARLAFELALQMRDMNRLGYDEREMLSAAFRGAREIAENPPVQRERAGDETVRDQIRERLKTRLRTETHSNLQTQQRLRTGPGAAGGQTGGGSGGQGGRR